MSETTDDRAAKAARAKALLAKKRQQKKEKAGDSISAQPDSAVASPVIPPRTFSPAPVEPVAAAAPSPPPPPAPAAAAADLGDLFSKDSSDASDWLTSLPRANASSPPPLPQQPSASSPLASVSSHVSISSTLADAAQDGKHKRSSTTTTATSAPAQSPSPVTLPPASTVRPDLQAMIDELRRENARLATELEALHGAETAAQQAQASLESERTRVGELTAELDKLREETEIALQRERQTVSLLVNEKAFLSSELQKREEFESRAQSLEELLASEKESNADLSTQARRWESDAVAASERVNQLSAKEKELVERLKEQERQLQLVSAASNEFKKSAEDAGRKLRELEEQIQADDRIDRLESSLKNTQDRADSLESSLSKLKNAHTALKAERDALDAKCQKHASQEAEHTERLSILEGKVKDREEQISRLSKEKDELSGERAQLLLQSEEKDANVKDLQERLLQASSTISTTSRQLQTAQNDLKAALRRAEDADKAQKALQNDGNDLMRSVNEMRPKIVELTAAKLELSERIQSLEHELRGRDATISQLEGDLDEARDGQEQGQKVLQDKLTQLEKQLKDSKRDHEELQKAYNELQEELDSALVSLRSIEAQRNTQHQEAARRIEEQERLTNTCHSQETELKALRAELEKQRQAHEELEAFLVDAQNDVESLRSDLHVRDQEIELLRETLDSSGGADANRSLDGEMVNSLRQQHALDLSAASSQVRALEDIIFERETTIHGLQKQIASYEEQLTQVKSNGRAGNGRFSPAPSRPHSRALDNDLRRASFGSSRGNNPAPLARSVFEHNMTPEQIRKRKVSLSMLKARIESEVAAAGGTSSTSGPPSRSLSPVQSEGHRSSFDQHPYPHNPSPLSHPPHRPQFLDESHVFWCHSCQGDLVIL